jgi:hypothetical protein
VAPKLAPTDRFLIGMLAGRFHLHESRSEHIPGCPRVTVKARKLPPARARGGHVSRYRRRGPARGTLDPMPRQRFDLLDVLPTVLHGVVLDFNWSRELLWDLDLPV